MSQALQTKVDALRRFLQDPERYAEKLLWIKTIDKKLKRLTFNGPQRKINAKINELQAQGKPVWLIILKARREGVSTLIQSRGFHMSATTPYTNGLVIAQDLDGSDTLFGMARRFYDHLPATVDLGDGQMAQIKPHTRYSNRKELVFDALDSQINVATAENEDAGRTSGNNWLHCSELAFWPRAEATMLSLLQTVPGPDGTMVVLESTANGVGGYFHEEWQRAKRGESDYTPIFLAWHEFEEYRMPVRDPLEYDGEEKTLREAYGLDDEQLQWRRWTIANKCKGDVENFHQEYPSNDTEAFLTSGRPFFAREPLQRALARSTPGVRGYLNFNPANGTPASLTFEPDPDGWLRVWKAPEKDRYYAIGADVAEGLEKGDYSTGQVFDRNTGEHVAEWHGHIDADLLGVELVRLARWYNQAWLGVESNNHGLTTNKAIAKLHYRRMLARPDSLDQEEREIEETERLGWRTDPRTRPVMLDALAKAFREGAFVPNGELISECLTFVRNEKGKPEAQAGCFDDRVIAAAIMLQVHTLCPLHPPKGKLPQVVPSNAATGY